MNVVWAVANVVAAAFNVALAVFCIRAGRVKFGPWWVFWWAGFAVFSVVGVWWSHSVWFTIGCGTAAILVRSARVRRTVYREPLPPELDRR